MANFFRQTLKQCQVFSVLIIESDVTVRSQLHELFSYWFSRVDSVGHFAEAEQQYACYYYDLIVLDKYAHQTPAFQTLSKSESFRSELVVNLSPDDLYDYPFDYDDVIFKPLDTRQIQRVVGLCFERKIEKRNALVSQQDAGKHILASTLIGNSEKTKYLRQLIKQYASSKAAVLIEGEPRVGKELTARAIHAASQRIGPFVSVNCSDFENEESVIRKIFGQFDRKGNGRLWLANYGTLFLNAVECLPVNIQKLFVQLFESRTFKTHDSGIEYLVDVRIIAATTENLHRAVIEGNFLESFYERLSVQKVTVPPLRERTSDLSDLFPYLTRKLCRELALPVPEWIQDYYHFELWDYNWPGNVKELKNLIERCLLLNQSPSEYWEEKVNSSLIAKSNVVVSVSHSNYIPELPASPPLTGGLGYPGNWSLKEVEIAHIQQVVHLCEGNKSAAARLLGISRKTLDRKFKELQSDEQL